MEVSAIIAIVFGVILIVAFVMFLCCRGKDRNIHIVRKYIDKNPPVDKKKNPLSEYVIEFKYKKNEKATVLRCDKEIYDKLRIGKDYNVEFKSKKIVKVNS